MLPRSNSPHRTPHSRINNSTTLFDNQTAKQKTQGGNPGAQESNQQQHDQGQLAAHCQESSQPPWPCALERVLHTQPMQQWLACQRPNPCRTLPDIFCYSTWSSSQWWKVLTMHSDSQHLRSLPTTTAHCRKLLHKKPRLMRAGCEQQQR